MCLPSRHRNISRNLPPQANAVFQPTDAKEETNTFRADEKSIQWKNVHEARRLTQPAVCFGWSFEPCLYLCSSSSKGAARGLNVGVKTCITINHFIFQVMVKTSDVRSRGMVVYSLKYSIWNFKWHHFCLKLSSTFVKYISTCVILLWWKRRFPAQKDRKGTIETVHRWSLPAVHVWVLPLMSRLLHQTAAVQISLLSWKYGFLILQHHQHHLGLNKYQQSWSLSSRLERKHARIPTPLAAAGYPAPLLTWYNLPAFSSPETLLQPTQLHPLSKTTFHLVIRRLCGGRVGFKSGDGCLFVSEKACWWNLRRAVWCSDLNGYDLYLVFAWWLLYTQLLIAELLPVSHISLPSLIMHQNTQCEQQNPKYPGDVQEQTINDSPLHIVTYSLRSNNNFVISVPIYPEWSPLFVFSD